jgi:hypothetical protein
MLLWQKKIAGEFSISPTQLYPKAFVQKAAAGERQAGILF